MSPECKGSEDVQMHMKRHPISLVIMEMQTKTTARNHFIPPRMAPQMARNSERQIGTSAWMEGDVEKLGPSYTAGGNVKW